MSTDTLFSLAGKCALITGGGSGIGQAIAHGLSDAGAQIIVAGRRQEVLEESLGDRNGAVVPVDLMDRDAPQALLEQCKRFGLEPDVIVNAAGINLRKPADEVTQQYWDTTLQLNLTAPFFLAQTFVPLMRKKIGVE
jgi:NAD(P)-dependent dehydrogenase (short-subunit alcohol dehydrogenase family)